LIPLIMHAPRSGFPDVRLSSALQPDTSKPALEIDFAVDSIPS
jgi:hypothetical protein